MHIGEILVLSFLLFVIVGMTAYVISIYNGMIALKKDCGRSWANIDVLLKQRHDELP
jgi:LemA protein